MRLSSFFARTPLACLLPCFATALAQTPTPALDQLLSRVEINTEQYKATVPNFFCDEHIISQEHHDGRLKHETSIDALFRVTRSAPPSDAIEESREVKAINGVPSSSKKLNMPLAFSGGFSGALAKFLSAEHRQCFDYQPDRSASVFPGTEAFTFTARQTAAKLPVCSSIQPGTTGKFVIDSATTQVTHIERTVPNPIGRDQSVLGTAAVDFTPVTLNGKSFWLPSTITAFTTETPKTSAFRFTAKYSNYHRFAASSTILPTAANSAQPQPR
jgi:hypothetical protein